jgi:hypothetical protein
MSSSAWLMIFSGSSRFWRILFRLDLATLENRSKRFICKAVFDDDDRTLDADGRLAPWVYTAGRVWRGATNDAEEKASGVAAIKAMHMALVKMNRVMVDYCCCCWDNECVVSRLGVESEDVVSSLQIFVRMIYCRTGF